MPAARRPILERAYSSGQDSDIAAHLGEVLWQSGDQAGARKVCAEALAQRSGLGAAQRHARAARCRRVPIMSRARHCAALGRGGAHRAGVKPCRAPVQCLPILGGTPRGAAGARALRDQGPRRGRRRAKKVSMRACAGFRAARRRQLALDGPLGVGGARVTMDGTALSVVNAHGERLDSDAARAELKTRLGFDVPLASLRYWILGVPDPASPADEVVDVEKRLTSLQQGGWQIEYADYVVVQGEWLPGRMTLQARGCAGATDRRSLGIVSAADSDSTGSSLESLWPAPAKLNLFLHVTGRRAGRLSRPADALSAHRSVRQHRRHACDRRADRARRRARGRRARGGLVVRAARALQAASGTALGRRPARRQAHPDRAAAWAAAARMRPRRCWC